MGIIGRQKCLLKIFVENGFWHLQRSDFLTDGVSVRFWNRIGLSLASTDLSYLILSCSFVFL
ncbi:uncharacterized protein CANTADRAFT_112886 [Suhomyces tanzawaensis NRRL Y-17324]|uniref:Uncharacterized protein n=1 Tax=Suhomyces tanzawaensis NRRL Y-17324 TaxID=984487 RepID=A0A1E4SQA8_9ASCO|nr:uncharacterized protein CANTADRAFT_112886 [Suhomyces tanzawaensis NRRL Y-17324]ODV81592.1 hypothetical protein CANTADRAFT_112886 [Suhomyces tanzawaensis NRRL Y-17324]